MRDILVAVLTFLLCLLIVQLFSVVRRRSVQRPQRQRQDGEQCRTALFLGSGGHTTELLQLLSALSPKRYSPRIYIISEGDRFSRAKAIEHEASWAKSDESHEATTNHDDRHLGQPPDKFSFIELPRARKVHQSFLSAPASVLLALIACLRSFVFAKEELDLILMNGPGTCVPIVITAHVQRLLGMQSPHLIYVESFARVKTLSLTAKLVRPFVDRFVLQWPPNMMTASAAGAGAEAEDIHKSWLV